MANYANQKTITIQRDTVDQKNRGKQYILAYTENIANAARNLNGSAFKLYIYLLSNQDGFTKDYSPQHFENIYGVSNSSAKRAFQELIEAGYIEYNNKNNYNFNEVPQVKSGISLDCLEIEKRYIPQDNGLMVEMSYLEVYNELKEFVPEEQIKQFWNNQKIAI